MTPLNEVKDMSGIRATREVMPWTWVCFVSSKWSLNANWSGSSKLDRMITVISVPLVPLVRDISIRFTFCNAKRSKVSIVYTKFIYLQSVCLFISYFYFCKRKREEKKMSQTHIQTHAAHIWQMRVCAVCVK